MMWYQRRNAARMTRPGDAPKSYEFYKNAQANLAQVEYEDLIESGSVLFDTTDALVERIRALEEQLDLNYLMCWINIGGLEQDKVLASMDRFACEVMPYFQDGDAARDGEVSVTSVS